jgi:uncharacterized membrane protein
VRLNECVVVSAPSQAVWDYLAEPENYLRFMSGVTRWEVTGDKPSGLGARYRVLMRVGAVETGGLVEMVEWSEPRDMAWTSVTGVDQRLRWRIREIRGGRCKVEVRFAYGVAGAGLAGWISEKAAAPTVRRNLRRSLNQLKRQVEHERLRVEAEERRAARERTTA